MKKMAWTLLFAFVVLSSIAFAAPVFTYVGVAEPDNFYSPFVGNNIINLQVNVSEAGGLSSVLANFSNLTANCPGETLNLTLNATTGSYEGDCEVGTEAASSEFSGGAITITAINTTGGFTVTQYGPVIIFNMTVPPDDPMGCLKWGAGTINMSEVLDFERINMVLVHLLNGSPSCHEGEQLPWGNVTKKVMKWNFSSINLSTEAQAAKMGNLMNAIDVEIDLEGYGDSRLFVNTTLFAELSTQTTLMFFDLPFAGMPSIVPDNQSANITGITWVSNGYSSVFNSFTGNLTFTVNGFSGFNISDNVTPTVTINTPVQGSSTSDTTPLVNVTLNGTGTQISAAFFYIDGTQIANYTNITNTAGCTNETAGTELFKCVFSASTLTEGTRNLTVTAFDFGGTQPGNNATASVTFTVAAAPTVVVSAPAAGTYYGSNFTVSVNATDVGVGVSSVVYRVLNSTGSNVTAWTSLTLSSGLYTGTFDPSTVAEKYNYTFMFNATDNNGTSNETVNVSNVHVDLTPPKVSGADVTSISTTAGILSVTASDSFSSISGCNYTGAGTGNLSLDSGTSYTATLSDLSAATQYTVNATCSDSAGNANSSTNIFTTSSLVSTGTSGGGGGLPAGPSAKKIWNRIDTGSTATLAVTDKEIGVTKVEFSVTETITNVELIVQKKDSLPSTLTNFTGKVFRNLEIKPSFSLKDEIVKDAKIEFKVNKSWLTDNGLTKNDIALFRYSSNIWNQLDTSIVKEDTTTVTYRASTPGFSFFIIGQKEGAVAAPTEEAAPAEEVTEVAEAAEAAEPVEEPIKEEVTVEPPAEDQLVEVGEPEVGEGRSVWPWVAVSILVIVVIVALVIKPKKK